MITDTRKAFTEALGKEMARRVDELFTRGVTMKKSKGGKGKGGGGKKC